MHGQIKRGEVRLLTRTGLNWTGKYPPIVEALAKLPVRSAYLDGELCGVRPDGTTSFSMMQAASDAGNSAALAFFLFDCLYLDGQDLRQLAVLERKQRLAELLAGTTAPLQYNDHQIGRGPEFHVEACKLRLEGRREEDSNLYGAFPVKRSFLVVVISLFGGESRSSSRRLRSGSRSAGKGSRARNGGKAWRLAGLPARE
jgi:hypothetical protein